MIYNFIVFETNIPKKLIQDRFKQTVGRKNIFQINSLQVTGKDHRYSESEALQRRPHDPCSSSNALYSEDLVSFDSQTIDQKDAEGFAKYHGFQARMYRKVMEK